MLSPEFFVETLEKNGIDFFAGVPDSLLKSLCACIAGHAEKEQYIIAANEGGAIGLAAGYHLAAGKIPAVYMQNSGLGNAVNPLLSMADREIYGIPILLLVGRRGEPGTKDEPQHIKQGRVTGPLLDCMEIRNATLSKDEGEAAGQIEEAYSVMGLLEGLG